MLSLRAVVVVSVARTIAGAHMMHLRTCDGVLLKNGDENPKANVRAEQKESGLETQHTKPQHISRSQWHNHNDNKKDKYNTDASTTYSLYMETIYTTNQTTPTSPQPGNTKRRREAQKVQKGSSTHVP